MVEKVIMVPKTVWEDKAIPKTVYDTEMVPRTVMVDVPRTVMEEFDVPRTVYDTVSKVIPETVPRTTYERVARETIHNPISGNRPGATWSNWA
jgi:hypothetical protein